MSAKGIDRRSFLKGAAATAAAAIGTQLVQQSAAAQTAKPDGDEKDPTSETFEHEPTPEDQLALA